jgi:hypothetical protein
MNKSLRDITPTKYRCDPASTHCPAIFKTDRGTYIIIGKRKNESAVEISADLLEEALNQK